MLDGREAMRLSVSLPRRERRQITRAEVVTIVFQSTLPRRERRSSEPHTPDHARDFNPRSHEGSDKDQAEIPTLTFEFQSTLP